MALKASVAIGLMLALVPSSSLAADGGAGVERASPPAGWHGSVELPDRVWINYMNVQCYGTGAGYGSATGCHRI